MKGRGQQLQEGDQVQQRHGEQGRDERKHQQDESSCWAERW